MIALPRDLAKLLQCPQCASELRTFGDTLQCLRPACGAAFPVVGEVPVLLNEKASIFEIASVAAAGLRTAGKADSASRSWMSLILQKLTPAISNNLSSKSDLVRMKELLLTRNPQPRVLVLGGGIISVGTDALLDPRIALVESDVYFGPRTQIIIDAHDIPFASATFDGVVMQAVLEHVADPQRVVSEVIRVLKGDGLVYASVPFMQQVHMGAYDFTRFTELGLRRLFRQFDAIDRGVFAGSGVALAWAVKYYLMNWSRRRVARRLLECAGAWLTFWMKHTDHLLKDKPGAYDAASGFYFLGRKSDTILPDRELIKLYRGALGDRPATQQPKSLQPSV